ncbi:MAG: YlmH/Sll1252 family protein [Catonella sp.]
MDKEENLVFRHLLDMARVSFTRDITVFSDFLNVREVAVLKRQVADLPGGRFFLFGGIEDAERVIACFPASYEERDNIEFPISCVEIIVKSVKFEKNSLSHRDFLGAILGLGIDRKLIGDIYTISENNSINKAFVLCQKKIESFLIRELKQIGRYQVNCLSASADEIMAVRRIEDKFGTVPSLRLDVIIGEALNISRAKVKDLIETDKVAVNSASVSSSHYQVIPGDIISVRGFGKFIFYESSGRTKKDRIQIHLGKYC